MPKVAHMVHSSPHHRIAKAIKRELDESGITVRQASEQTAIPRTTLTRKLQTGDFTVTQLAALAALLHRNVSDFLKDAA